MGERQTFTEAQSVIDALAAAERRVAEEPREETACLWSKALWDYMALAERLRLHRQCDEALH